MIPLYYFLKARIHFSNLLCLVLVPYPPPPKISLEKLAPYLQLINLTSLQLQPMITLPFFSSFLLQTHLNDMTQLESHKPFQVQL